MLNARQILEKTKKMNEENDSDSSSNKAQKAIDALIATNFSASDEEKGKAKELLSGLFFSEDQVAKDFIKKLDDWMSSMKSE